MNLLLIETLQNGTSTQRLLGDIQALIVNPDASYSVFDQATMQPPEGLLVKRKGSALEIEVEQQPVLRIDEFFAEASSAVYSVDGSNSQGMLIMASAAPVAADGSAGDATLWQASPAELQESGLSIGFVASVLGGGALVGAAMGGGSGGTDNSGSTVPVVAVPVVTAVSLSNSAMKIGDLVTVNLTVADDGGDLYTNLTGTVGGFDLSGLTRVNSTTYIAQFSVTEGGSDVASDADIPVSLTLDDSSGNKSSTFVAAISRDDDSIDANSPAVPSTPILSASSDSGISDSDQLTNDSTPTITGSAEANATVELFSGEDSLGTVTADASGDWSLTTTTLSEGEHSIVAQATDAAGNVSDLSSAVDLTIDSSAPVAPLNLALAAGSDSGISDSDQLTNDSTPTITGSAEANATVELFSGEDSLGTVTADASGDWSLTTTTLSEGEHSIVAQATDAAGNVSDLSSAVDLTIDSSAPVAPLNLALAAGSDSGISDSDQLTNDSTPTITGSAEANATVELFSGEDSLGTVTADASGDWSLTTTTLSEGEHSIVAQATDAAGNFSVVSEALTITVDITAPSLPADGVYMWWAPEYQWEDGLSISAGINVDLSLDNYSSVQVTSSEDGLLETAHPHEDGFDLWQVSADLSEGVHSVTVTASDAAGNISDISPAVEITVDTIAPVAPLSLALAADSDTGQFDVEAFVQDNETEGYVVGTETDRLTADNRPTFIGTAEAGATIELLSGENSLGTVTVGESGDWSLTATTLAEGEHSISARAIDVAGNISALSELLTITVDTISPTGFGFGLAASSDSGISSTDNITNDTMPTFNGTAEGGDAVLLISPNNLILGAATVGDTGDWSITPTTAMADGSYEIVPFIFDTAGNFPEGTGSTITVSIDTSAPDAPLSLALAADSDTGISNSDQLTKDSTPTITGSAEANATVELFSGEDSLGTVTADASGDWSLTTTTLSEGEHSIVAQATDAAGNFSVVSEALTITVDITAPSFPADGVGTFWHPDTPFLDGTILAAGIAFILPLDDYSSVQATSSEDGMLELFNLDVGMDEDEDGFEVWHTDADLSEGVHSVTVTASDAAGNISDISPAVEIMVDTIAPEAPVLDLTAVSDSGSSATDNITSDTTPTFSGTAEANAFVSLYAGDTYIGGGYADASGDWSITIDPLSDGDHNITADAYDSYNASDPSEPLTITIDTAAPVAPLNLALAAGSDTGISDSDQLTNDSTPTITGSAEANATVELFSGEDSLGTVTADASGDWSLTTTTLSEGEHSIVAQATDAAGNFSVVSEALTITVDITAPSFPADGVGTFWHPDTPFLDGTILAAGIAFTLPLDDYSSVQATSSEDGMLELFYLDVGMEEDGFEVWHTDADLSEGVHSVTVTASDAAGNISEISPAVEIMVDTIAPVAPVLDLTAVSDSGSSATDNITSDTTPTFSGTAEANASVSLYAGDTYIGGGYADASGDWSITIDPMSDGDHNITADAYDSYNASDPSEPLTITIDTAAPVAPLNLALAAGSDSGISDSDQLTNDSTPTITGSAEANATVELFSGEDSLGTVTADASGDWSLTTTTLSEGEHSIVAQATDAAGNFSVVSEALTITVDITAPSLPADGVYMWWAPEYQWEDGLSISAGINVHLSLDNYSSVQVTSSEDGLLETAHPHEDGYDLWQVSADLSEGVHSVTVTASDAAGNISEISPAVEIMVDTIAPVAPVLDLTAVSDSGSSATDNITSDTTPTFSGTAEANAFVSLYAGDTYIGGGYADASGDWSITIDPMSDGDHNITAEAYDFYNNTSDPSEPLTITIDSSEPTLSAATQRTTTVSTNDTLVMSFDEDVRLGSGNITLTDGSEIITIDVATSEGQLATSGGQLTITPTEGGDYGSYYLQIDSTAITDVAGNAFNYLGEPTPEPEAAIEVVFDLVNGTSTDVDSRIFAADESYNIYILVDSFAADVTLDVGNNWTGANNLGSDDTVYLVGSGSTIVDGLGHPFASQTAASGAIIWADSGWFSGASAAPATLSSGGIFYRSGGLSSSDSTAIFSSWSGIAAGGTLTAWPTGGNSTILPTGTAVS